MGVKGRILRSTVAALSALGYPLTLAFCLPVVGTAAAQGAGGRHYLGVGGGVVFEESRDELTSPLRYRDTFFPVQADYEHRGRRGRSRLAFSYGRSRPTSAITRGDLHAQEGLQVRFLGRHARRIVPAGPGRDGLFAGVQLDTYARVREHRYREHVTEATGFLYAALGLSALGSYRLRRQDELRLQLDVPVAAYVRRPPYSLKGYYEDYAALPGRFARFGALLAYELRLARPLALRAAYEGLYYRMEDPLPAAGVEHAVSLCLVWVR
jgi:hypothetical protein